MSLHSMKWFFVPWKHSIFFAKYFNFFVIFLLFFTSTFVIFYNLFQRSPLDRLDCGKYSDLQCSDHWKMHCETFSLSAKYFFFFHFLSFFTSTFVIFCHFFQRSPLDSLGCGKYSDLQCSDYWKMDCETLALPLVWFYH